MNSAIFSTRSFARRKLTFLYRKGKKVVLGNPVELIAIILF